MSHFFACLTFFHEFTYCKPNDSQAKFNSVCNDPYMIRQAHRSATQQTAIAVKCKELFDAMLYRSFSENPWIRLYTLILQGPIAVRGTYLESAQFELLLLCMQLRFEYLRFKHCLNKTNGIDLELLNNAA